MKTECLLVNFKFSEVIFFQKNKLDLEHLSTVDFQISKNARISILVLTDWIIIVIEISVLTLKYVSNKRDD